MVGRSFYPFVYVGSWGKSQRKWAQVSIFGYPDLRQRVLRADLTRPTLVDIARVRAATDRGLAAAHDYYTQASAALDAETKHQEVAP